MEEDVWAEKENLVPAPSGRPSRASKGNWGEDDNDKDMEGGWEEDRNENMEEDVWTEKDNFGASTIREAFACCQECCRADTQEVLLRCMNERDDSNKLNSSYGLWSSSCFHPLIHQNPQTTSPSSAACAADARERALRRRRRRQRRRKARAPRRKTRGIVVPRAAFVPVERPLVPLSFVDALLLVQPGRRGLEAQLQVHKYTTLRRGVSGRLGEL
jgi:hypothetical protein